MRGLNRQWSNAAARCFSSSSSLYSHVGSQPIPLPASITCNIHRNNVGNSSRHRQSASVVRLSGPRGSQEVHLSPGITATVHSTVEASDIQSQLSITCQAQSDAGTRGQWGLSRAMCANAVRGLSEGFSLPLRFVGVGYRASVEQGAPTTTVAEIQTGQIQTSHSQDAKTGRQLVLRLGFPRPIRLEIPPNIECEVPSPTELRLKGPDKQELAQFAARIRQWRKPEPYNGKGIFIGQEKVVRKEVKKK